ncbi:hypothetical protein Poli38472_006595 [Pythium oligandrum]|uniref:Uncharacterized protein n=1 Tax=Pythium oligandrum TaxID=41045 RepID=A0A8K1C575_PYTOL|nr:hypothetical protein Poli38472_006595 [Pythium oligandrum]|eukprot:TMW56585.1 hypothetical protein Poli38472_006595 [Pythium oligandrum]
MNVRTVSLSRELPRTMGKVVVASRLHWSNHARTEAIDDTKALRQADGFCRRAATYGDAVVLAIGLPSPLQDADVFTMSVHAFVQRLQTHLNNNPLITRSGSACPVVLVPMTYWGSFVPALNAIIATTATRYPDVDQLLFQSLEIVVDAAGVDHLRAKFQVGSDLVVGAALPGHSYQPNKSQPLPLTGLTTPWNTLAVWDLTLLAKVGFPLVGEGLRIDGNAAGVEEVSTIALYQSLYPDQTRAKVIQVPGLEWQVDSFDDPERQRWQERKMQSKLERPAKQMEYLSIPTGQVYHL